MIQWDTLFNFGNTKVNLSVTAYQVRILLRRTSPHVWRRIVIPGHFTLSQLHQTIRLVSLSLCDSRNSFPVDPTAAGESAT